MKVIHPVVWIFILSCWLAGCGGEGNSNAAIQRAIEQHLSTRPGLAAENLVLEVGEVQIQGEQAEAEVIFYSTTQPTARMAYHYQLRKQGGQWKVESGRPSAAESPHPSIPSSSDALPSLPEEHPPVPEGTSQP